MMLHAEDIKIVVLCFNVQEGGVLFNSSQFMVK